jgi:hypothetical protein
MDEISNVFDFRFRNKYEEEEIKDQEEILMEEISVRAEDTSNI